jgi:hypothetical protein
MEQGRGDHLADPTSAIPRPALACGTRAMDCRGSPAPVPLAMPWLARTVSAACRPLTTVRPTPCSGSMQTAARSFGRLPPFAKRPQQGGLRAACALHGMRIDAAGANLRPRTLGSLCASIRQLAPQRGGRTLSSAARSTTRVLGCKASAFAMVQGQALTPP